MICAECRSHSEGLQALRQELSSWPAVVHDDAVLGAIRAGVLQKLARRKLWGPRFGWAAVLIVPAGAVIAGWLMEQSRPMPELARVEPPATSEMAPAMPRAEETKPTVRAPKFVQQEHRLETPPAVRIAAIISADPETGTTAGMMLELESRNRNVVLYFLADNQGD